MTRQKIGFIGLGAMGSRMVCNLKGAGDLIVLDADATRTAQSATATAAIAASSLEDMAAANVVVLMLPNSVIVDQVCIGANGKKGLIDILAPGSTIIDMSSSDPTHTVNNAKQAQAKGLVYIDAPVSGGIGGAESAKLAIMVGGTVTQYESVLPLLSKMGTNVVHAGAIGSGHAVKALNNLLAATIFAATAEVFAVGEKFGLDPVVMHKIVNASSGGSFMSDRTWPRPVLQKTWDFGFAMQLMHKDVGVAMSLIKATGVDAVLCKANAKIWDDALQIAKPGSDMTILAQHIQQKAGL